MEKQELNLKIRYQIHHEPDNEAHLQNVLRFYLESKGIKLTDEGVLEV